MFELTGTCTVTIPMSNTVNGQDADWDEPCTVSYRVNPVGKTCEITDVRDGRGCDAWLVAERFGWSAIEEACIEHAAREGVGP